MGDSLECLNCDSCIQKDTQAVSIITENGIWNRREKDNTLLQKLFLAPREDLAPNAYVLNLMCPGASRFVRSFQECIERKRETLGIEDTPRTYEL